MELIRTDMDRITQNALQDLIESTATPCLSIYMPTHRYGRETEQNSIRLKNLLSQAENDLSIDNNQSLAIGRLVEPLHMLVENREFWQHQSDGLAIFHKAGRLITYRLPTAFDELVVLSEQPHIKPLLPLLTANGHFYLLALSQNQVRLFEGTRLQIGEVDLGDTPTSLTEAMRFDDFEDQLQFHTQTGRSTTGGRAAMFHGHSNAGDDAVIKENIKRFLQRVDEGVRARINGDEAPLLLAGVEMLYGLYREVSHYASIIHSSYVEGNPEQWSAADLHTRAWPLVEPLFSERRQDAIADFCHLAGTEDTRASTDLQTIISGAYFQRVDTLFVQLGLQQWGTFDKETNYAKLHKEQHPGDFDLFDFAAIHTLINGGTVYAVPPEQIPGTGAIAAIFRYGQSQ